MPPRSVASTVYETLVAVVNRTPPPDTRNRVVVPPPEVQDALMRNSRRALPCGVMSVMVADSPVGAGGGVTGVVLSSSTVPDRTPCLLMPPRVTVQRTEKLLSRVTWSASSVTEDPVLLPRIVTVPVVDHE